jgi:hypothetical protein
MLFAATTTSAPRSARASARARPMPVQPTCPAGQGVWSVESLAVNTHHAKRPSLLQRARAPCERAWRSGLARIWQLSRLGLLRNAGPRHGFDDTYLRAARFEAPGSPIFRPVRRQCDRCATRRGCSSSLRVARGSSTLLSGSCTPRSLCASRSIQLGLVRGGVWLRRCTVSRKQSTHPSTRL